LVGNHPGNPWHRFPTLGLLKHLQAQDDVLEPGEEERDFVGGDDSFFNIDSDKMTIWSVVKVSGLLLNPGWTS
jgi:hypothetical protein